MNWSAVNTFPGRSVHSSQAVGVSTGGNCSSERRNDLSHYTVLLLANPCNNRHPFDVMDGEARFLACRSCEPVRYGAWGRQLRAGTNWSGSIGDKSRLRSLRGLLVSAPQGIDLDSPQLAFTNMAARGAAFFWDRPDHLARLHHREAGLGGMGEVEGKQLCRKVATKSFPRKSPPMGPVAKNSAPL